MMTNKRGILPCLEIVQLSTTTYSQDKDMQSDSAKEKDWSTVVCEECLQAGRQVHVVPILQRNGA